MHAAHCGHAGFFQLIKAHEDVIWMRFRVISIRCGTRSVTQKAARGRCLCMLPHVCGILCILIQRNVILEEKALQCGLLQTHPSMAKAKRIKIMATVQQ